MNTDTNRHARFLLALGAGALVASASLAWTLAPEVRVLLGVNVFCLCYLAMMARAATAVDLRRHASRDDEGVALILALAAVLVATSLAAIFMILNADGNGRTWFDHGLALAAVPLGWAMVQTLMAFHYGYLYFRALQGAKGKHDAGLRFPGADQPGAWDFLYFAFGIGMTAQVSDVTITTTQMRRLVMFHAVASFFYNAVIIALSVNAAMIAGS